MKNSSVLQVTQKLQLLLGTTSIENRGELTPVLVEVELGYYPPTPTPGGDMFAVPLEGARCSSYRTSLDDLEVREELYPPREGNLKSLLDLSSFLYSKVALSGEHLADFHTSIAREGASILQNTSWTAEVYAQNKLVETKDYPAGGIGSFTKAEYALIGSCTSLLQAQIHTRQIQKELKPWD